MHANYSTFLIPDTLFLHMKESSWVFVGFWAMVASSSKRGKKIVNWIEPSAQLFFSKYDDCAAKFEECGWLVFCQKLQGHDANVTLEFA